MEQDIKPYDWEFDNINDHNINCWSLDKNTKPFLIKIENYNPVLKDDDIVYLDFSALYSCFYKII